MLFEYISFKKSKILDKIHSLQSTNLSYFQRITDATELKMQNILLNLKTDGKNTGIVLSSLNYNQKVYIKNEDIEGQELRFILINNVLYFMGIGAKVDFHLIKNGKKKNFIVISKDLGYSKSNKTRKFYENEIENAVIEKSSKALHLIAIATFLTNIEDVKRLSGNQSLNYGFVVKEDRPSNLVIKGKIFDFNMAKCCQNYAENFELLKKNFFLENEMIFDENEIRANFKLDKNGNFLTKQARKLIKIEDIASFDMLLKVSFKKAIEKYKEVFGKDVSKTALEDAKNFIKQFEAKLNFLKQNTENSQFLI